MKVRRKSRAKIGSEEAYESIAKEWLQLVGDILQEGLPENKSVIGNLNYHSSEEPRRITTADEVEQQGYENKQFEELCRPKYIKILKTNRSTFINFEPCRNLRTGEMWENFDVLGTA